MDTGRHRPDVAGVRDGASGGPARLRILAVLALLGTSRPVLGGDWDIEPGLRLSETWTDNIALSSQDPESEWITEIAPSLRVSGEGRRARLDLAYRLQHLLHVNERDRDRTNHLLNGDGTVELVRERLFFDAGATRSLDSGGPGETVPASNLLAPGQRGTVTTWSAGPRLQYRLGRFAGLEAQYRRDHVEFDSRDVSDSDSDLVTVGLASGPLFTRWGWALDYSRREESREELPGLQEDTTLEQLRGELSLRAGPATQLFVAGGTEDNEFETAEAGEPVDGDFWEAGIRWNPRRTVSLVAAAGERFFGDTARASLRLRGSALTLELDVSEDLVTTPELQLERSTALLRDSEGNLVIGPGGQPVTVLIDVPTVRDDVILQQRASARLRWERGHTQATLGFLATDREFLREVVTEQERRINLEGSWSRLRATTITAGLDLHEQEFARLTGREDDTLTASLEARRRLAADADLTLVFEHVTRDSTQAGAEFDSNRVTLAFDVSY